MLNVVVLRGRLSRPIAERVLPSGDRLAMLDLTIPADVHEKTRAETVPLAWFDAPAWVTTLDAGAELVVLGRVRRRFFQSARGVQSRTEVIVEAATPARRTTRVVELLRRATQAMVET